MYSNGGYHASSYFVLHRAINETQQQERQFTHALKQKVHSPIVEWGLFFFANFSEDTFSPQELLDDVGN